MRKKRHLVHLLSAPVRYIKLKVKSVYKKLVKETDNEVYNEKKLKKKSIDDLKEIKRNQK